MYAVVVAVAVYFALALNSGNDYFYGVHGGLTFALGCAPWRLPEIFFLQAVGMIVLAFDDVEASRAGLGVILAGIAALAVHERCRHARVVVA